MKTMQSVNEQIAAIHEQTGPLVVRIVQLTNEVEMLREKLQGEQTQNNESFLRHQFNEKNGDLNACKKALTDMRFDERNALMDKYELIEWELQNKQANPHDEEQQRMLQRDIQAKIQTLSNLITNGK